MTARLAEAFAAQGHSVRVVTHRHPQDLPAHEEIDGVAVRRLPFTAPSRSLLATGRFLASQPALRAALDGLPRPDLIHVHGLANQALPLARYASRRGVPFFATTHGEISGDVHRVYERSRYVRASFRHACSVARALTAPSSQTLAEAVRLAPHNQRKARVITNGVDQEKWGLAGAAPLSHQVMAWGRLEPQKGFDRLMAAWPLVREQVPDAVLRIAGEGGQAEELSRLVSPGVRMMGRLSAAEIVHALQEVQFAAVPSRVEAFGMSALEALAAGRRVLHSGLPALAGLVGEHGWAADHDDARLLADRVVSALREAPVTVPGTATAAYAWRNVARQYLDVYALATPRAGEVP